MIRFNNDYNRTACDSVVKLLNKCLNNGFDGYGTDIWCDKAKQLIRSEIGDSNADIYFFAGATQANLVTIAAALRPIESVISAVTGHINCHEAASIENTGHKIITVPSIDGKLTAADISSCASKYYDNQQPDYLTIPKMVYLSFPTELGTLYSLEELKSISEVCHNYGMMLFIDGARLGYGLTAKGNDVTPADLAKLADVFYIGGTKCGAMFGEAVVITSDTIKCCFKNYMKQHGAVLAKGWLLGLQFYAMFNSGEYFTGTARANEYAYMLKKAFAEKNIPFYVDSNTNQQFVLLTKSQQNKLAEKYLFEKQGISLKGKDAVRFCTSWATEKADIESLIADIADL